MPSNLKNYLNKEAKTKHLNSDSNFQFTCSGNCWGTCCIKENVVLLQLSVYDVYKLLNKRTDQSTLDLIQIKIDEDTNFPKAYIKWKKNGWCPNLEENGACKIYMDRPFACRIFPLSAEFKINDATKTISVDYKLRENLCFGFHKEAEPIKQTLKHFLNTDDFETHEQFEKLEILKRDEWLKKYNIKELSNKQVHSLAQTLYCLRDKVLNKDAYFFDIYSEMLNIPKRLMSIENFTIQEISKLALEVFTPRLLEKFTSQKKE